MAVGRIVRAVDFERVLACAIRARSGHFAVHHLAGNPAPAGRQLCTAAGELSTGSSHVAHPPVEDCLPTGRWLGAVVPKRHARRSVTRSLLKRQIRAAFLGRADLPAGLWVVRLRAPFDRKLFPSAASEALRLLARTELAQLLDRAISMAGAPAGLKRQGVSHGQ